MPNASGQGPGPVVQRAILTSEAVGGAMLTTLDRDARASDHRAAFERLRGLALPAERTPAYIEEIIAAIEADADPRPAPARDLLPGRRGDRGAPRTRAAGGRP
ncbi:hypothetical protein [Actinomadura oligospora]|uniref:hypothetical protein n=1 Tax=Actinomadura oligospora TaxID=111804 RepID=UPI00047AAAA0|nr:hypothetical protein [Actinomadura oligospora]